MLLPPAKAQRLQLCPPQGHSKQGTVGVTDHSLHALGNPDIPDMLLAPANTPQSEKHQVLTHFWK